MRNDYRPFAVLLMVVFFHKTLSAQETPLRTWTGFGVEKELNKSWDIQAQTQWRTEAGDVNAYLLEVELGGKWGQDFKTSGGLRRTWRRDDQGGLRGYQNIERVYFLTTYKHETGPLDWKHRLQFQSDRVTNRDKYLEQVLRMRTEATYKIKDWKADPNLGFEWFHHIDHPQRSGGAGWRIKLGTELDAGKDKTWKIDYIFDQNLIQGIPYTQSHIIKLSLDLAL